MSQDIILKLDSILTGIIQVFVEKTFLIPVKDYDLLDNAIRFKSLKNYDYVTVYDFGSHVIRVYIYNDYDFDIVNESKFGEPETETNSEDLPTCRDHIVCDIIKWKEREHGFSKGSRWDNEIWNILRREDLKDYLLSLEAVDLVLLYKKVIIMMHRQM